MKNCKYTLLALSILGVFSCAPGSSVKLTVSGLAEGREIVARTSYEVLDTLKTDNEGTVRFATEIAADQPEFLHFYLGERNLASVILKKGDRIELSADTLGNCTVSGSAESEKLIAVNRAYAEFTSAVFATEDSGERGRLYLDHYRACLKFLVENPHSLACIPVLYEKIGEFTPLFNQQNDAVYFRTVADSLKLDYPESRYVKALEKVADYRMARLGISERVRTAKEVGFPHIELPDMTGRKVSVEDIDAKVILLHFWDASDVAQKMLNIEVLLPLYNEFKDRGFEIFSVCLSPDKAAWAGVVNSQKLPWVNVNDGMGANSQAAVLYNVQSLPTSLLLTSNGIEPKGVSGKENLRKAISLLLK